MVWRCWVAAWLATRRGWRRRAVWTSGRGALSLTCGESDGEGFTLSWRCSAASEDFLANGFVNLSIRKHSWREDDVSAVVGFINDGVFDGRGWHGVRTSWFSMKQPDTFCELIHTAPTLQLCLNKPRVVRLYCGMVLPVRPCGCFQDPQ